AVMTTRPPLLCGNCFDHWNDVVGFWRQCAVRRPCIHEFAALFHCPAPAIGLFSGIANGMRQRHFDHVARKPCQVTSPITEAGTEAVDGDVNTKGLQHTQHGSVRYWPVVPMSRKDKLRGSSVILTLKNLHGAITQRHDMRHTSLHALCRYDPKPVGKIDLVPC